MSRRSKGVVFSDFSGGLNADASPTTLELNQALDLDNVILLPKSGFKKRNGNSTYNSSAMASGAAVHGLGYYRQSDGDEWLMAITGTALFKSEFDGTMDTITGSLTITTGQDNIWTYEQMNDIAIFVGGNRAADVPIKWSGSGNGAALGGTPPVGKFCIKGNNRLFIGNTVANPSRIYWSILGNPEDWSGSGSGSQDVSTNDKDQLVGAVLLSNDHLLVFKQNSIHELVIRTAPFPLFPLFSNVGSICPPVDVDGIAFFITPEPRMKATDGTKIIDFPDTINSIWDGLVKTRLQYIQGVYDRVRRLVMWFCSSGGSSTNNYCIAWDLDRKAWLKFTTGHDMNVISIMKDRTLYGGAYDGKVYELNDSDETNDASEGGAAIDGYWRSGWMDMDQMIHMKHIPYVDLNFRSQGSGTFDFSHGYDFNQDTNTVSISQAAGGSLWDSATWDSSTWGGLNDKTKMEHIKGNGKFFQFRIRNANASQRLTFNRLAFPVNVDAPYAVR